MKQTTTILSTCIALIFMASCAAPKPMGATAGNSAKPEFIDGITVAGGSSNVKLTQKKQVYRKIGSIPEELETAEQPSISRSNIQEGKKRNKSLYTFIEEWYGTPYRFGGTSKTGIDCSAFTRQLYEDVYSLDLFRTSIEQFASALSVRKDELKEGDLVFFKIHGKRISHVGVYLYDGKFVHASVSQGVVISDLGDAYWTRYYAGAGRMG
ncbi:C40 family peptidase [Taibaiella helva]|uniref:C40 family peptidase n=1 Tax=Taibaiella helva TaxID=2301235 RepID=UPI000E57D79E|nr:C40 family peptidase [Taibaiella helva]